MTTPNLPPPPPAMSGKDFIDPGDVINKCFSETFAEARERLAREAQMEEAEDGDE